MVQTKYNVVKDSLLPSDVERMTQEEQGEKKGVKDRCRSRLFLMATIFLAAVIIGWISILTGNRRIIFGNFFIET